MINSTGFSSAIADARRRSQNNSFKELSENKGECRILQPDEPFLRKKGME